MERCQGFLRRAGSGFVGARAMIHLVQDAARDVGVHEARRDPHGEMIARREPVDEAYLDAA